MELTWFGNTCIRLRGRDAVVVADPYQAVVGPTGRGITGEIVTFSHPDDIDRGSAGGKAGGKAQGKPKGRLARDGTTLLPTSLEQAFVLDGPGEYEVRDVLVTGVRTYRDDVKGRDRGRQTAFVLEVDGIHTIHLGDIGHLLTEEELGDIGSVDVACVPVGGALTPNRAAELIAQLDPKIVVPMPLCDDEGACEEALATFFHEMGGAAAAAVPRLAVTPSSLPSEVTTVRLESRGKA
jgi:L-ascorbate metabolism protein UlaG (beta-lactamase superfamily)